MDSGNAVTIFAGVVAAALVVQVTALLAVVRTLKSLSARIEQISKWPSRQEQLSLVSGQILSPGARLLSQILAPGGALASQLEKKSEGEEKNESEPESPAEQE